MLQKVKRQEIDTYSIQVLDENIPMLKQLMKFPNGVTSIEVTLFRGSYTKVLLVREGLNNISASYGCFIVFSEDGTLEVLSGDVYRRTFLEIT